MGDVSLGTAPTEDPADNPQKSEWDLPEFDITIHPNGKATILMDGVPLKMTRGVQVYQHIYETPEVVITYLAGRVRLRGPARHSAIIQPLDLDFRGGPEVPLTIATDGVSVPGLVMQHFNLMSMFGLPHHHIGIKQHLMDFRNTCSLPHQRTYQ